MENARPGCLVAIVSALTFVVAPLGCYGCSHVKVSDGYRDSTIRKLSETGVFWKTHEAETIGDGYRMTESGKDNGPGNIIVETFGYTVRDPQAIEAVKMTPPGKRVRIHYTKYLVEWYPRGESRYELVKIEPLP